MTPIQQIARVSHPLPRARKWVAMAVAYFDESGHLSDQKAFSLAFVAAKEKQWEVFQAKWRRRLRRDGLESFHMTDFIAGKGPFRGLSERDKTALITDLGAILVNNIGVGNVHCFGTTDWKEILARQFSTKYESPRAPYVFLLQGCMHWIEKSVQLPVNERIACVCEENKPIAHAASHHYARLKAELRLDKIFSSISFVPKDDDMAPLEAADILAYLGFKYAEAVANRRTERTRPLLSRLLDSGRITLTRLDRDALRKFYVAMEEVRAERRGARNNAP